MSKRTRFFSLRFFPLLLFILILSAAVAVDQKAPDPAIACPSCGYLCDPGWFFCIACGFDLSRTSGAFQQTEIDRKVLSHVERTVLGIETKHKDTTSFNFMTEREAKRLLSYLGQEKPDESFYRSYRSGWLYDAQGNIVTSAEVLENAEKVRVRFFNNEEREAKVVGYDLATGVGVIKIEGEIPKPLLPGKSQQSKTGDSVWAVGFPIFYREKTFIQRLPEKVSRGTITDHSKTNLNIFQIENYLQSDISPNSGMYGGPLVNASGEVIGMITKSIDEGIGMASPIELVRESTEKILKGESLKRGHLGIGVSPLSPFLREKFSLSADKGLVVEYVIPSSPAEAAGVKKGDLLLQVGGQRSDSPYFYQQEISGKAIGDNFDVVVKRGENEINFAMKSTERPKEIVLQPLDEIEQYYGIHLVEQTEGFITQQGLKITGMIPGSLAESREFEIGDLIYKVDDLYMVLSEKDFNEVLGKLAKDFQKKRFDKEHPTPYKTFKATFTIRKKDGEKKTFTYSSGFSNYYQPAVI